MGANSSRNETGKAHRSGKSNRKTQLAESTGSGGAAVVHQYPCTEIDQKQAVVVQPAEIASAGESAAAISAAAQQQQQRQQRSRQQSSWSLGSLSGRLYWSFSGAARTSFANRNKTAIRKSFNALQQRRSKTSWHRPLTNAIFSSHFKQTSRNETFQVERLIAKGAFGVVFKVIDKQKERKEQHNNHYHQQLTPPELLKSCTPGHSNSKYSQQSSVAYALKVLKKSKVIEENSVQQIKDEADIQRLCGHHPFIVQQIDLWQNRHNLHILSEYVPNGELFSKIVTFSLDLIRLYVAEIALAIDFLHNAGIIYRDAKPENILLTETYHIKLTDFGLSKWLKLGSTTCTMCGTFQYMAPEILRGERYGHAVDWWSLGMIACQMLTDKCPDIKNYLLDATFSSGETNIVTTASATAGLSAPGPNFMAIDDDSIKITRTRINLAHVEAEPMTLAIKFLPSELEGLSHAARDLVQRLLEFDPKRRLLSILALQRIAFYQHFKIDQNHLLSISALDIILRDKIKISQQEETLYNDGNDAEAFANF